MTTETETPVADSAVAEKPVKAPKAPKARKPKAAKKAAAKKAAKPKATKKPKTAKADRKPREKKEGLRRMQVRALRVLRSAGKPLPTATIAEKAGISTTIILGGLGSTDDDVRKGMEQRLGFDSLLTLKHVRAEKHEGEPLVYSATKSGLAALEKYEAENGKQIPKPNVNSK